MKIQVSSGRQSDAQVTLPKLSSFNGLLFALCRLKQTKYMAGLTLTDYEPGVCDVDMFAGWLSVESLWQLGPVWAVTGHRTTCNEDEVRPWIQVASSPMLLWIPLEFSSAQELAEFRQEFVQQLFAWNIIAEPYAAAKESYHRPMCMVRGKLFMSAIDLGLLFKRLDVQQVHRLFAGKWVRATWVRI